VSAIDTQDVLAGAVVDAIRSTVGEGPVALHEPWFRGNEWAYVKECLDTTYVSSVGKFVDRFETDLAEYTGASRAVAVVNGTAALHVALKLVGVQPGDEVLMPALTFVATAAAVSYCNATPHFADSEERTLGLDPRALREYLHSGAEMHGGHCINRATGRRIRAMVPMHTFGHAVDIDGLLAVARDFNIVLIEDAAESLGTTYASKHTGTFGAVGVLSFNGNKTVTTGGGGALLFSDRELAAHAKHLTTTAKIPHRWEYRHDEIGFNYRLPNINAALGCAQLERMPCFLEAKRRLFELYRTAFAGIPGVTIVTEPEGSRSNFWLQALILDTNVASARDAILARTNDAGFMTRPSWTLMHELGPYAHCPRMDLPVAESLAARLVNIPSSPQLLAGASV
jgi:perosamine synthetase